MSLLKRLLRLEIKRAEGIYYDRDSLHRAVVVQTPFGKAVRKRWTQAADEEPPEDAPKSEKKPSALASARSAIGIGLPVGTGFFASMPAKREEDGGGEESAPLAGLLAEDAGASGVIVERARVKLGQSEYVLSAAARRADLNELLELVGGQSKIPITCEPSLFGALRGSWRKISPGSASAPELRLWLGDTFSFLALSQGRVPLALEEIPPAGDAGTEAIISATARMLAQLHKQPKSRPLKRFIVHAQHLPSELLVQLEAITGVSAQQVAAGPLDGQAIAEGLAFGALAPATTGLNLAKSLQKAPSILATLPWFDMLLVSALTFVLAVVLGIPIMDLDHRITEAKAQQQSFTWAHSKSVSQLKKEVSTLRKEIEPLQKYLTEGVQWTPVFAEIPSTLPAGAWITALHAEDMIWAARQEKEYGQRFILLRESTPLGPDGSAPLGIDEALASLRRSRLVELGFPTIRLTDVHWRKLGTSETTGFSIAALPKSQKGAKKKG